MIQEELGNNMIAYYNDEGLMKGLACVIIETAASRIIAKSNKMLLVISQMLQKFIWEGKVYLPEKLGIGPYLVKFREILLKASKDSPQRREEFAKKISAGFKFVIILPIQPSSLTMKRVGEFIDGFYETNILFQKLFLRDNFHL